MSIPDFDVEPAAGPRFWAVFLGVLAAVVGLLAVIGWPLPVGVGRYGFDEGAWARIVHDVEAWLAHDGWRVSGSSWVYGAASVALLAGAVVLPRPGWSDARRLRLVVVPAGLLLLVGPATQWALGLPWSNYGVGSTAGIAGGLLAAAALAVVGSALWFAVRRRPGARDRPGEQDRPDARDRPGEQDRRGEQDGPGEQDRPGTRDRPGGRP